MHYGPGLKKGHLLKVKVLLLQIPILVDPYFVQTVTFLLQNLSNQVEQTLIMSYEI